jgi:3-oxoacyl-[acyl-carrier-protein] synthase-3
MTSLEAVSSYLPRQRVPITALSERLGLTTAQVRVFQRYYGLAEVRAEPDGSAADLLVSAARGLPELRGQEDRVRFLIQARSVPQPVPYPMNILDEVARRLTLTRAVAFAVTEHACASGLLAIDVAGRLLAGVREPHALALVVAGDKPFTPGLQFLARTTIMGEGAGACLVRHDGDRDHVLAYATRTHGRYHAGLALPEALAAEFEQQYTVVLAEVILTAVAEAGLCLDDVALVLPHNINTISWMRVCKRIGLPLGKVFLDNVPRTAHCFCADAFINYRSARGRGLLRRGDRYLIVAVGLGSTFSAMVFQH